MTTRLFSGSDLVIATHNPGKLAEFRHMFGAAPITLTTAAEHGLDSPEETGTTFLENVTIKALYAAKGSGLPALADDSGMCVDLLSGAPGVYSADWAGDDRDFGLAIRKVHEAMVEMIPPKETWETANRRAQFVSVIMLAWPDGHVEWVEGLAPGTIVWPPRGQGGHGYDPIFAPQEDPCRTYAEMAPAEKNVISHRARAFQAMLDKCFPHLR